MKLGFGLPVSGSWATPDNQLAVARRAEELGYASLWTFQRLLFPAETDDRRWSPTYRSVLDPLVSLAYVAGATSRIRLGVAVLNMPFYSPALLAKSLTTLDVVSRGRLDVGLGLGWAREEYVATGAAYEGRGRRSEEFVAALRALWTAAPAQFAGESYEVPASYAEPQPVQRPHPPLLLGGSADVALRRAGRIADGWVSGSGQDLEGIAAAIAVVRAGAEQAGRDPDALRMVCRGVVRLRPGNGAQSPAGHGAQRRPLTGTLEQVRADLETLRAAGVTEVFADLNFDRSIGTPDADAQASMAKAHEVLDALAPAARE